MSYLFPSCLQGIQLLVYETSQYLRIPWGVCSNNVKERSHLHVGKFYSLVVVRSYQAASQRLKLLIETSQVGSPSLQRILASNPSKRMIWREFSK